MSLFGANAPAARYHALLAAGHFASTRDHLAREIEARTLYFLGRPILGVLRPFFLSETAYDAAMTAALGVSRALSTACARLGRDPDLRRELGMSAEDEALLALEPDGLEELSGRLDGFLGADGVVRFIEYNSMGAGTAQSEEMSRAFWEAPIMTELRSAFDVRFLPLHTRVADALVAFFRARGGVGIPSLAVVSTGRVTGARDLPEGTMIAPTLRRRGIALAGARSEELEARADGVYVRGERVNLVIVDFFPEFLGQIPSSHPFWDAVRSRSVHLVKSPRAQVLRGDKRVLSLLSDPRHASLFDLETQRLLARHVPWTRVLRDETTTFEGRRVSLPELVVTERERFALKPSDGYGGTGVLLGWEHDARDWGRAVDEALGGGGYVVQERVKAVRELFPMVIEGELALEEAFVNFSPFVWCERSAEGAQVRVSRTSMMNLCAGTGSCVPLYLTSEGRRG